MSNGKPRGGERKNMDCKIKTETFADLEKNYHACECECALCRQEAAEMEKPYYTYALVGEDLLKNAQHYVEHGAAKDVAEALRMMAAKYPVSRLVPYLLDGQTIDTVED